MSCSRSSASLRRPCHPIRQIVEASGVVLIQLLERHPVPGPDSSSQLQVGASHVS